MLTKFELELKTLEENNTLRTLKVVNNDLINLASNDYLGYGVTNLYEEFIKVNDVFSFGASGSRLLTGNHNINTIFENYMGELYNKEALLFNSGYSANVAVIKTLLTSSDIIFMDNTNHASLFDAAFNCGARVITYKHLDYSDLEKKLTKYRTKYNVAMIISESLFSMDGDIADITKLVKLKKSYNTLLYIDEAHSFGIYGGGLGLVHKYKLVQEVDFIMLGFGKALNSSGSCVITSNLFKTYLVNKSKEFIYTTGNSPIIVNYNYFLVKKLLSDEKNRKLLKQNYELFNLTSPIMALKTYDSVNSKKLCDTLLMHGFLAYPINYPTVKKGHSIVRVVISSSISYEVYKQLKLVLEGYGFIF